MVGPAKQLGKDSLTAKDVNWVMSPPQESISCTVKIRYKSSDHPAEVRSLPGARVAIQFTERLRDIAPGQAAVFYQGEHCLGGGIIK